jgi:diadenosine tetraphosphate (Ap4A) HIT family hydrolase
MDIMPRGDGHVLVIPKAPSRNILDIEPGDLAALYAKVQKVARAALKAFGADGITIQQFNEPAGGQVVFHTHVHVIPRHAAYRSSPTPEHAPTTRCWPSRRRNSARRWPAEALAERRARFGPELPRPIRPCKAIAVMIAKAELGGKPGKARTEPRPSQMTNCRRQRRTAGISIDSTMSPSGIIQKPRIGRKPSRPPTTRADPDAHAGHAAGRQWPWSCCRT